MKRLRLWPQSLGGRTMLVLVTAVVLVHVGTMTLYRNAAIDAADRAGAAQLAGRIAAAREAVLAQPPNQRDAAAHKLSSDRLTFRWNADAMVADTSRANPALRPLKKDLLAMLPQVAPEGVRVDYSGRAPPGDPHLLIGAIELPDRSFLDFSVPLFGAARPGMYRTLVSTVVMALGVAAIALVLVRSLTAPLRKLAAAADAIGRGPEATIPEEGPRETAHVARAFNGMQRRIRALVDERTQALAAVSHDLRTSITRLRLRAGFLDDAEAQSAIDAELDEMDAMLESVLVFLRGDASQERHRNADISAMLATLVDAATDAGRSASFTGPPMVFRSVRPFALKRAFANLIENAVSYGGTADVTLTVEPDALRITVDDNGPGMAPGEIEQAFEPFRRFDTSRNRSTGGFGLGLSIVRQVVHQEGGKVTLSNRDGGGLRAEVVLTAASMSRPDSPAAGASLTSVP